MLCRPKTVSVSRERKSKECEYDAGECCIDADEVINADANANNKIRQKGNAR